MSQQKNYALEIFQVYLQLINFTKQQKILREFSYSTQILLIKQVSIGLQFVFLKKHVFYFDPLSAFENATNEIQTFLKRYDKHLIFNNIRIQSYDSTKCGIHCLVFCFVMSIKPTLRTYTKYLKTLDYVQPQKSSKRWPKGVKVSCKQCKGKHSPFPSLTLKERR